MEKIDGVTLKERTASNPTAKDYRPLLECILKVESQCFKVVFSLFGDLYYKEDASPELQMIELYADSSEIKHGADCLRVGSNTHRAFWGPFGCHFPMCLSKVTYLRHRNQGDLLLIIWQLLPNPGYPRSQSTLVPETTLTLIALITHRLPVLICLNVTYVPQRLWLHDSISYPTFHQGLWSSSETCRRSNICASTTISKVPGFA